MEDICLCIVCQVNEVPKGSKKFCSRECYLKNQTHVALLRRRATPKEPEVFPFWTCDLGHRYQLDFDPIKDKDRWKAHSCAVCSKVTEEDLNEHIKVMIT